MEGLDYDLNEYFDSIEDKSECMECGVDVQLGKQYCCFGCFNASHR
jgi:hypothetical protein